MVAWQRVKAVLKRFSELHVGIEPTTFVTAVGCSNHCSCVAAVVRYIVIVWIRKTKG